MLDKVLEIGSAPDWVSPLIAMVQDRVNGPSHMFLIPDDCGWSGMEIKRMLEGHGVQTWGLMIVDHLITISVRLEQATYAQHLLLRERIAIEYGILDERSEPAAARAPRNRHRTRAGKQIARDTRARPETPPKRGIFAELAQVVDGLMDELEALFGL